MLWEDTMNITQKTHQFLADNQPILTPFIHCLNSLLTVESKPVRMKNRGMYLCEAMGAFPGVSNDTDYIAPF